VQWVLSVCAHLMSNFNLDWLADRACRRPPQMANNVQKVPSTQKLPISHIYRVE